MLQKIKEMIMSSKKNNFILLSIKYGVEESKVMSILNDYSERHDFLHRFLAHMDKG